MTGGAVGKRAPTELHSADRRSTSRITNSRSQHEAVSRDARLWPRRSWPFLCMPRKRRAASKGQSSAASRVIMPVTTAPLARRQDVPSVTTKRIRTSRRSGRIEFGDLARCSHRGLFETLVFSRRWSSAVPIFSPLPLAGEGQGGGPSARSCRGVCPLPSPPPQAGEGKEERASRRGILDFRDVRIGFPAQLNLRRAFGRRAQ